MADKEWRLLVVDDDVEICSLVVDGLDGEAIGDEDKLKIETESEFAQALERLEKQRFDLVILDVRLGTRGSPDVDETAGISTLESIRERRFLPVVFYTAAPLSVQGLGSPLVQIVEKSEGIPKLLEVVKEIFETRLPVVNRALIQHVEKVQCAYMWNFVADNWEELSATSDHSSLAYLLARRLAKSLSGSGLRELIEGLGYSPDVLVASESTIHPMEYYIMPPVNKDLLAGDIYWSNRVGEGWKHFVGLTPSCDLVPRKTKGSDMKPKADYLLLAECSPLSEQEEYKDWEADPENSKKRAVLEKLMKNRREKGQPERYYFLPGVLNLPPLVVDFQRLLTVPYKETVHLQRLASLDSPFAEALLTQFSRFFGRLGTPDLNTEAVINRMPFTMPEPDERD